jgi:hypothetical protein
MSSKPEATVQPLWAVFSGIVLQVSFWVVVSSDKRLYRRTSTDFVLEPGALALSGSVQQVVSQKQVASGHFEFCCSKCRPARTTAVIPGYPQSPRAKFTLETCGRRLTSRAEEAFELLSCQLETPWWEPSRLQRPTTPTRRHRCLNRPLLIQRDKNRATSSIGIPCSCAFLLVFRP